MTMFRAFMEGHEPKRLSAPKGGWGRDIVAPISWEYLDRVHARKVKIVKNPLAPYL